MNGRRIGTCLHCGTGRVVVVDVLHRDRNGNGKRTPTKPEPICSACVIALTRTYSLDDVDGADMGESYFTEGWHADGLRKAFDVHGGHE